MSINQLPHIKAALATAGECLRAMTIFIVMALLTLSAYPQSDSSRSLPNDTTLTVSLITCWPGPEIYELCGHEAIRIKGEGIDSVWNYGLFSFDQPNFVYRFVKGETDYMVGGYPFKYFLPEYIARGSKVMEQELNLSQEEIRRLKKMLRTEVLPANRVYRYNYVKDNCATRIVDRVDSASSKRVIYPDSIHYGTFRKEMRAYHKDYPWYQFGIDLALGSGLDRPIDARAEMFVPIEMYRAAASAHFEDGTPFVKNTVELYPGRPGATLPPTPFWITPLAISLYILAISIAVTWWQWRNRKVARWYYSIFFGLLGLAGCIIAFLVFISEHEATSPNALLLWLNPLQLLIAIFIWWRRTRIIAIAAAICDVAVTSCLLTAWPWQAQSANPAFFPMMAATALLAAVYAIIDVKYSYNNNIRRSADKSSHNAGSRQRSPRGAAKTAPRKRSRLK